MSGEEKGDAKQEQTADDRRHDGAAIMPLSQAARIARLRAPEEESRAAQQPLGDRDRGRDRLDPTPADLAEVMAHAPQEPRADRVRDAADRPDRQSPGAVGHQHGPEPDQPVLGDRELDADLDSAGSDDRDRLQATGLNRPATRPITRRKGHGTDQRPEHPPEAKEGVERHHVSVGAAVTAAHDGSSPGDARGLNRREVEKRPRTERQK